jgi:hypothetical protein
MPVALDLPEIPGDPAGMRALAAGLRSDAQAAGDLGSGLTSRFEAVEFYGPAADRIEGRMQAFGRGCVGVAHGLLDLANLLDTWAARVEAEQAARARKLAELRRELAPEPH